MKNCQSCKQKKSLLEFYKSKNSPDGHTDLCKECAKAREKKYYHNNAEKRRFGLKLRRLKKSNGNMITLDQYNTMLETQNGLCGICNVDMTIPCIDHNHTTGEIRMLLCTQCNTLLGMAKENTSILKNAIDYLRRFE